MRGFFYFYILNIILLMQNFLSFIKHNYKFASSFILIFYVSLLDYHSSVDKVSFQWIYLSAVSIILLIYFFWLNLNFNLTDFKRPYFVSTLGFYFFSLISFFYSDSIYESIISFSRLSIILIVLLILYKSVQILKPSFLFISYLVSIFLLFESLYSLKPLLEILSVTDFDPQFSTFLKGVTGNKNITSAILAIKIPFVFYILLKSRYFIIRLLSFLLIVSTFVTLFFLSTRGVLLSFLVIYSFIFLVLILQKKFINLFLISSPVILSIIIFNVSISSNNSYSLTERVSSIATPSESSVGARLRYYSHALEQIKQTPLTGVGLGNWKIKSVLFDSQNIVGYTVPYNVHNDLLEFGAEIGIIGSLFYFLSFLFLFFLLFKFYRNGFFENSILLVLFSSLFIYFIDLNLNFPTYRPAAHINLLLIVAIILNLNNFSLQNEEN